MEGITNELIALLVWNSAVEVASTHKFIPHIVRTTPYRITIGDLLGKKRSEKVLIVSRLRSPVVGEFSNFHLERSNKTGVQVVTSRRIPFKGTPLSSESVEQAMMAYSGLSTIDIHLVKHDDGVKRLPIDHPYHGMNKELMRFNGDEKSILRFIMKSYFGDSTENLNEAIRILVFNLDKELLVDENRLCLTGGLISSLGCYVNCACTRTNVNMIVVKRQSELFGRLMHPAHTLEAGCVPFWHYECETNDATERIDLCGSDAPGHPETCCGHYNIASWGIEKCIMSSKIPAGSNLSFVMVNPDNDNDKIRKIPDDIWQFFNEAMYYLLNDVFTFNFEEELKRLHSDVYKSPNKQQRQQHRKKKLYGDQFVTQEFLNKQCPISGLSGFGILDLNSQIYKDKERIGTIVDTERLNFENQEGVVEILNYVASMHEMNGIMADPNYMTSDDHHKHSVLSQLFANSFFRFGGDDDISMILAHIASAPDTEQRIVIHCPSPVLCNGESERCNQQPTIFIGANHFSMSIPIISHGERLFELNFPSLFDSDRNSPLHEQYKEGFRINFGNECLYNRNVELTDCLLQVWESEYFPNVPKSLDSKRELAEISLQSFDSLRGMNLVVCPYSPTKIELFRGLGLVLQPDTAFVISNNYNNTEDMRYTLHDISDDKGTDDGHMDSTTASEFENELAKVLDEHNKNSNSNDNDHGVVYAPDVVANKRRIMIGNDHILTLSPLFNALPHVCGNECVGIVNQVKAELEIIVSSF
eukprot:TRINITY_DN9209_c0_g1_i8.p1 TRINITY_DN9209_c0_g1~~TRINITY_DN9209_c0_g1_i8.p1  ORF type:complete len:871 (+),score=236.56 TRINITY_DN9209_c0_g1_i8:345-2615(+)